MVRVPPYRTQQPPSFEFIFDRHLTTGEARSSVAEGPCRFRAVLGLRRAVQVKLTGPGWEILEPILRKNLGQA
jgi:hypothetical protein